ncbi:MAG TPA: dihydrolipoamide acetyltransferase family protein [Nitriliruptorales bacterium]|nr:dihydrolipoamide acetyltransferase family protein [Nitriliruptorales bacterium]
MGQIRDFLMPDLGEGLESGEIVAWNVDVGDRVELNQEICEVETAKATVAVPSPFAGTVVERFADVGDELEVGIPLVRIDVEEEHVPDAAEAAEAGPEADESTGRRSVLVGYGAAEGRTRRRRSGAVQAPDGDAPSAPLAKPPVRKLAGDLGVDLAAIAPGSGPGGAITREDVRAAAAALDKRPRPVADREGFRGRSPGEVLPVTGVRKRIVAKVTRSRTTIPEATTSVTVDCTRTWELASELTTRARAEGHDVRVSAFAVVTRSVVLALRRFPTLNAVLDEDAGEIRLLEPIHLGVAVDTDRGLLVPVVRNAHSRTTLDLARELDRLTMAAREGSVGPDDLTGGTFTINNYGALGSDWGDPIINHPEAGILGVGAMKERPWVADGRLVVRRTVTLTIAFDHRISDGGEAGRFVAYVGDLVEQPARIVLHA